jgi:RNA polymerase sigma factor (sigma-70 family)
MMTRETMEAAVEAARRGDIADFGRLVEATGSMAYAVAWQILRNESDARDAVQEAYLAAFRGLTGLGEPDAFAGWLRRIVVTSALNHRRRARTMWVGLDEKAPPVLDAGEQRWTDDQRRSLARGLLTLSDEERRLCELHYHGGATAERLAQAEGIDPAAMRKRLQRVRDKLRKEIEMDEKRSLDGRPLPEALPASIMELLARPRLVDLPENPVAAVVATLRGAFPAFSIIDLPEEVDLERARQRLGGDAVYIDRESLHRIEGDRVLRYDLTLPLLLSMRWKGAGERFTATGKVYRRERETPTHLEAFHQLEVFAIDDHGALDVWRFTAWILDAVDRLLPRTEVRMTPTDYPMCARAWSLDVRRPGAGAEEWTELMAWGTYADWVLRALGADPERQIAVGAGFGLERSAMLRHGIDDIRKVATSVVRS